MRETSPFGPSSHQLVVKNVSASRMPTSRWPCSPSMLKGETPTSVACPRWISFASASGCQRDNCFTM